MNLRQWITRGALIVLILTGAVASNSLRAQERERQADHPAFTDHDRDQMRDWYKAREHHPPRGFRTGDRLPPDLERRLVIHEVLPMELRSRIISLPPDLYRRLPPPPESCRYVVVGGHVVLIDVNSWMVHDVVHFELSF